MVGWLAGGMQPWDGMGWDGMGEPQNPKVAGARRGRQEDGRDIPGPLIGADAFDNSVKARHPS